MVKSFDTVDRGVLDLVPGRLGLLVWFRRAHFGCHANVRLRFKLACGLGSPWTRDGGIPQGCPLCMVFILLHCTFLGVGHWNLSLALGLSCIADNLKCVSGSPAALLSAAKVLLTCVFDLWDKRRLL